LWNDFFLTIHKYDSNHIFLYFVHFGVRWGSVIGGLGGVGGLEGRSEASPLFILVWCESPPKPTHYRVGKYGAPSTCQIATQETLENAASKDDPLRRLLPGVSTAAVLCYGQEFA
jgi:hypothetical protein